MTSRRTSKIGPPKGVAESAEAVRIARMSGRLIPEDGPRTSASETQTPVSYAPHKRRRREPEGMTRRTYYLPADVAKALDDAVAQLLAAAAGRATKHEALALILRAGCDQVPALADELRAALLAELRGEPPSRGSGQG